MSDSTLPGHPDWSGVREQLDELRSVLPGLSDLPDVLPENAPRLLSALAETTEQLRRRVLRDRILRASLQELMGALLQSRDPESTLHTVTAYLRQILSVDEVLLVRCLGPDATRWMGYFIDRSNRPERIDLVNWPSRVETGMNGKQEVTPAAHRSDPARYAVVLRLPENADAETAPDGYLCLNGVGATDEDWSPQELGRRVAGMLQTLQHREELERADRFRRQLLDAMQDGVLALDVEGRITEANAGATRLLETESLRGLVLENLPPDLGTLVAHLQQALKRGNPTSREVSLVREGRRLHLHVGTSELFDRHGQFRGIVVNLGDLSAIRRMEEEIDRLDRLAALGRFAAGVAHEVRNPLAGIGAGVEYLARHFAPDAPEQQDVQFVLGEVQRLNHIVSDLLDYTQPRPLDLRPIRVEDLVQRVRSSLGPLAREREVRLESNGPAAILEIDSARLEQVLLNLARNAIEASPPRGCVNLTWERRHGSQPFRFLIEDDGPGLSEEAIRRAFEPFFTTKGNGTGLGLYLSHAIVEQHRGRLVLGNRPGRGASISIELPDSEPERMHENAVLHLDH
jgi:PAS domain S-box-containing protein